MIFTLESDAPLRKKEELIIPYTCIACVDGFVQWSAYPEAISHLKPIQNQLEQAPFAKETLLAVEECLCPYLAKYGYDREEDDIGRYYETLVAPMDFVNPYPDNCILVDVHSIDRYENLTEFTFDYSDQLAYVTVLDGKIVSIAAENPNSTMDFCEIYVETNPDFVHRGYAQKNVAALTAHRQKEGAEVCYRCATDHIASVHIAKKLGFAHRDYFYCHNAYRMN